MSHKCIFVVKHFQDVPLEYPTNKQWKLAQITHCKHLFCLYIVICFSELLSRVTSTRVPVWTVKALALKSCLGWVGEPGKSVVESGLRSRSLGPESWTQVVVTCSLCVCSSRSASSSSTCSLETGLYQWCSAVFSSKPCRVLRPFQTALQVITLGHS